MGVVHDDGRSNDKAIGEGESDSGSEKGRGGMLLIQDRDRPLGVILIDFVPPVGAESEGSAPGNRVGVGGTRLHRVVVKVASRRDRLVKPLQNESIRQVWERAILNLERGGVARVPLTLATGAHQEVLVGREQVFEMIDAQPFVSVQE